MRPPENLQNKNGKFSPFHIVIDDFSERFQQVWMSLVKLILDNMFQSAFSLFLAAIPPGNQNTDAVI
jgi:hypothetical protein